MPPDVRRAPRLPVALLVLAGQVAGQEQTLPHDAYEGIDKNGRIERPEMPEDLANPDRWRYTPPGRISEGNVFERFLVSSFFSPIIFSEDDIGTGGGVAVTDTDFRNQRYRELASIVVTYTTEGQQAYTINWIRWLHHRELPNGGIIREDRNQLFGGAGYSKTLTRRFFGFGSDSPESAESSYTDERSFAGLGVRITLPDPGDDLILRGGLLYTHHNLSSGKVSSVPSTDDAFPGVFADAEDVSQLWVNLGIAYDTRDSLHQPYRGSRVSLSSRTAALQTGGDFGGTVTLAGQTVVPLPPLFHDGGHGEEENPPSDVLAIGMFVTDSHGDLPFYDLPALGGSHTLRGYVPNRFVDTSAAHATVEYRFGVVPRGFEITRRIRVERVGLAVFYDFGTVSDGLDEIGDAEYLDSYGIGGRVHFAREASFRADLGFSDEGVNFTIGFGNSF